VQIASRKGAVLARKAGRDMEHTAASRKKLNPCNLKSKWYYTTVVNVHAKVFYSYWLPFAGPGVQSSGPVPGESITVL